MNSLIKVLIKDQKKKKMEDKKIIKKKIKVVSFY